MESRFHADFGAVRVHTGDKAERLNRQFNAHAFTLGNQIFFGKGKFDPDSPQGRELIAHELTHTIQQGGAVQRSPDRSVTQLGQPKVQRLGLSDALDYFADKANNIPGFRMFTILLGVNPINMSRVERSAANILRAIVEFLPGGHLITEALDNYGVFDKVGTWIEEKLSSLGITGAAIKAAIMEFLDSLSWTDIFHLGDVWDRAKRIFTDPIGRLIDFAKSLITEILRFIRKAILRPLAKLAEGTRGYDLLKAILGEDPVTSESVPQNADTLIGGFMKLIGQEEIWENLKKSRAVPRAWAWFQGAMGALMGFVSQIPGLFVKALQSLELADIVLLPRAFMKVAGVFATFIGDFIRWAGEAVWNLLEIIFSVLAPAVIPYLKKAAGAFRTILRNPIGFVGNLVRAGLLGLRQFAKNFLTHLRASLVGWLTGALSGMNVYIPQSFTLLEVVKFVLSILGLTWQNIRQKLVKVIGETAVKAMETGFDIVVTLVTEGPAAAWEKIKETLSNLKEMVIDGAMNFVKERVVQAAIEKLATSLNPAGAFIQAIIAIYNTVMFFVERLRQIAQVAAAFIDSISAIASGAIAAAADRVETTMAGLLTLVISFLARIAGLGKVSDAVTEVVNRVRQPIDRALDRVVEWIVSMARRLGAAVTRGARSAVEGLRGLLRLRKSLRLPNGEQHQLYFEQRGNRAALMFATTPTIFIAWVDSIGRPGPNPDKDYARRLISEIDRLEDDSLATNRDNTERITILLEELGRVTVALLNRAARNDVRSTPPIFAGLRGEFGRGMRVMLATNDLRSGSKPSVTSPIFQALNLRRSGSGSFYVLGHLLNEHLGGPGGTWENLTPLSRTGNANHEQKVESIIKPTRGDTPRAFLYLVTPSYGRPLMTTLLNAINAASNPDTPAVKAIKARIATAEQHVAFSLTCSIREIDPLTGRQDGMSETYTISNEVPQRTPNDYQL
jgi:hypothetical protein